MYKIMFVSGLLAFIVFLLISIVLFVKNDIAKILGDLTGLRAKRTIRRMMKERLEKANRLKNSDLGKNISVRTSDLLDDFVKNEDESREDRQAQVEAVKEEKPLEAIEVPKKIVAGVFEAEEDMTVLGGEAFKRMSSKTSVEDVSYQAESLEEPETGILSSASYADLIKNNVDRKLEASKNTLIQEEQKSYMSEETGNDVDEPTSVLSEDFDADAPTSILENEEAITILEGGVVGQEYEGDEDTTILEGGVVGQEYEGDEDTTILEGEVVGQEYEGDEDTTILEGEVIGQKYEGDEDTTILGRNEMAYNLLKEGGENDS